MHLIDRRDASLAIALVVGTFVVFEQPLRFLLSIAEDVSQTYHVDLVPGFVIFVLVFAVHHVRKQRDARLAMQLAAKNADEVARLAADMQAVVAASQEIMTALDLVQLRAQAWQQIPRIVGDRAVWIAVTTSEGWQWLMEPGSSNVCAHFGTGAEIPGTHVSGRPASRGIVAVSPGQLWCFSRAPWGGWR